MIKQSFVWLSAALGRALASALSSILKIKQQLSHAKSSTLETTSSIAFVNQDSSIGS